MTKKIKLSPIIFRIVWTILYLYLLFFIIRIYQQPRSKNRTKLIVAFWIMIFFNIMWNVLYWKLKQKLLALIDLVLMIVVSLYILILLYPLKKHVLFYGYMIYTLWICFALFLTLFNKNY